MATTIKLPEEAELRRRMRAANIAFLDSEGESYRNPGRMKEITRLVLEHAGRKVDILTAVTIAAEAIARCKPNQTVIEVQNALSLNLRDVLRALVTDPTARSQAEAEACRRYGI